ncbi:MAG: (d)CMP kinase [Pseudomonadota bacterium]|nr:(d)CMP kinase [Pseudomonadota bacterium]
MKSKEPIIIAVDGLSASGKGAIGKIIAKHLNIEYLDTGLLYRAVAYKFLKLKIAISTNEAIHFAKNIELEDLNNLELRSESCGNLASRLAGCDRIRKELILFQRNFPNKKIGAVLDGRDIGSIIFPNAKIKFFITADLAVRAQRRKEDYKKMGQEYSLGDIINKLKERDKRDQTRKVSPLICMPDAIVYDNSKTSLERLNKEIIEIVEKKYKSLNLDINVKKPVK